MRRLLIVLSITLLFISNCGKKDSGIKLEKDTPAYQLAKDLAGKLDYLDPDKNNVLVSTTKFDITVGDVIGKFYKSSGSRSEGLEKLEPTRLKNYVNQLAQRLAEQKLLLAKAKEAGISATDAQVDSVLKLQYTRSGGEDKFLEMLEKNKVSIDFVKNDINENLSINYYFEKTLASEFEVPEEMIKEEYQKDKTATVRHILLKTTGKTDSAKQEIRKKMEGILAEAKSGKDFAELAKKYTEDPGSQKTGGLYENFGRGRMVKAFEAAAFSVPVGEISDIVETPYGYHILKVIDRKKETRPFEEVRSQIENGFKSRKKSDAIQNHLQKLKDEVEFKLIEY